MNWVGCEIETPVWWLMVFIDADDCWQVKQVIVRSEVTFK